MNPIPHSAISALILAGGRAQRMGGHDKGLVELRGQPMICHVIAALTPQLELIRINANRNQARYAALGQTPKIMSDPAAGATTPHATQRPFEVISDSLSNFQGPLAGIAEGLQSCPTPWMLVTPCDTPLLPRDLVRRLAAQAGQEAAEIAVAHDGQRMQPVISLIKRELLESLQHYLSSGERKIDRWYASHRVCCVDFSDQPTAFLNINSVTDKQLLENHAV
ncbi:MAG: molybdenum cofactor guanylyltransferase MobA [Motiliproteus sp.]